MQGLPLRRDPPGGRLNPGQGKQHMIEILIFTALLIALGVWVLKTG